MIDREGRFEAIYKVMKVFDRLQTILNRELKNEMMMIDQERKFEDESIRILVDTLLLIRIYYDEYIRCVIWNILKFH